MLSIFSLLISLSFATIYGNDDRFDFYQANTYEQELSLSSVAIIQATSIEELEPGRFLKYTRNSQLCANENYANQPVLASCSGVLISPRHVLTAGHCFYPSDCQYKKFVFGNQKNSAHENLRILEKNQVYSCKKLLFWQRDSLRDDNALEYGVIELDRDVEAPYRPARLASEFNIAKGTEVLMIGYPMGLEMKFSPGFVIRNSITTERMLETNLDAFGGNSGSPLFNSSGEVLGLLVNGDKDFSSLKTCKAVKRCSDSGCLGAFAVKINEILPLIMQPASYIQ